MAYPYKRRRASLVRNFWVYRRLVGLAMILGLMLWFIWANNEPVTVSFPFRLGNFQSTTGLVILLSALVGSALTALTMTLVFALRTLPGLSSKGAEQSENSLPEDLPPADYAAKASEAPPEHPWH